MSNVIISSDAKKTLEERSVDVKMLVELKERLQDSVEDEEEYLGFTPAELDEHVANLEVVIEQLQEMAIENACVANLLDNQVQETVDEEDDSEH